MSKKRPFISLNLKMTLMIVVAIVIGMVVFGLCRWFETYITQVNYQSDAAVKANVDSAYESLEEYIEEENVKAEDRSKLTTWLQEEKYTYLFVYDNYTNLFDGGWWVDDSSSSLIDDLDDEESVLYSNSGMDTVDRIDEETFEVDVRNRIIEFEDGRFYVYIDVYKEKRWQDIMAIVSIVLGFLTAIVILLVYNGRTLKRIIALSGVVQKISDGTLDHVIQPTQNDEIGALAESVDNMRSSIIQKHQNERDAWDANTQLITAMSHDIRTPLTSMIGYLDIIDSKKYKNQEELEKYLSSCREKAFQLKDLSDKLFQYFLVFGNKDTDRNLERFDASILFQQLLAEHCAECIGYGYKIDFIYTIPEVDVNTDISGLKRLFDNVFSNIMKYADKKRPVLVEAKREEDKLYFKLQNHIPDHIKKVESTRIGLKTCEKICGDLKGEFIYKEEDKDFTVEITFPIMKPEENQHTDDTANQGE